MNPDAPVEPPVLPVEPADAQSIFPSFTFALLFGVTGACGVVLLLISAGPTRCMGATRSARLQWEARTAEMNAAINAQTGRTSLPTPQPPKENP